MISGNAVTLCKSMVLPLFTTLLPIKELIYSYTNMVEIGGNMGCYGVPYTNIAGEFIYRGRNR